MSASGSVPPFYQRAVGPNGHIIDERVLKAAEALWPACCGEVRRNLADDGCTAELVEAVAEKVSDRLAKKAEVGRNLFGYFLASFIRRVRQQAFRDGRILYCGLSQNLDQYLLPREDADFPSQVESRVFLEQLAKAATQEVRWLLALRLLGWSWKEIAARMLITDVQARTRFHRGLRQAFDRINNRPEKRDNDERS